MQEQRWSSDMSCTQVKNGQVWQPLSNCPNASMEQIKYTNGSWVWKMRADLNPRDTIDPQFVLFFLVCRVLQFKMDNIFCSLFFGLLWSTCEHTTLTSCYYFKKESRHFIHYFRDLVHLVSLMLCGCCEFDVDGWLFKHCAFRSFSSFFLWFIYIKRKNNTIWVLKNSIQPSTTDSTMLLW